MPLDTKLPTNPYHLYHCLRKLHHSSLFNYLLLIIVQYCMVLLLYLIKSNTILIYHYYNRIGRLLLI